MLKLKIIGTAKSIMKRPLSIALGCMLGASSYTPNVLADIYKCTFNDGSVLFQTQCPENAVSAEKQAIQAISNVGFREGEGQAISVGDELIQNGDFENQANSWFVRGQVQVIEREGVSGTSAIRLFSIGEAKEETRLRQCIPSQGIASMRVAAFTKQQGSEKPLANELRVVSFPSSDCSGNGEYLAQLSPSAAPGWQKLEDSELVPSLGANSILLEIIHINEATGPTEALWDDVLLEVAALETGPARFSYNTQHDKPAGVNYLKNPSFEAGLNDWELDWPAEWVEYGGNNISAGLLVKASSDYGKKVKGNAFTQCVNIGAKRNYSVGASFKKDSLSSQSGVATLRVAWLEQPNCEGKQQLGGSFESHNVADWQMLGGETQAPEGAQSALLRAYQTIDDTGYFGGFWDDIYFKAIAD